MMMKSFAFAVLALFSLNLQAQLGGHATVILTPEPAGKAGMQWQQTVHDFGTLDQGEEATFTFIVTNTGEADLLLTAVRPSCSCTVADFSREPIAPGHSGFVKASYDTHKAGVFSRTITVRTHAENEPIHLRLRGEVK